MHHHPRTPSVLFILKSNPPPGPGSWGYGDGCGVPTGMFVSVQQIAKELNSVGVQTKIVQVPDNNHIHQEVVAANPTHVIVEGFWVVPDKFVTLAAMNPDINWLVRCHSNTEFLAHEGAVFGWAIDYLERGVTVAFNSDTIKHMIDRLVKGRGVSGQTVYLPNYYDIEITRSIPSEWLRKLWIRHSQVKVPGEFHVGCFGAVRPLKNHMNQALASLEVARRRGWKLRFYINAGRADDKDSALIQSLRSIFARMPGHELVEVPWLQHQKFLELLTEMDIVTQVSNSETFNIVLADAVGCGNPVIGANIPWLDRIYQAEPNDMNQIARVMLHTWLRSSNESVQLDQRRDLVSYVRRSSQMWIRFLNEGVDAC